MMRAAAYVHNIAPDAGKREENDFYPTPPEGTRALLSVESFVGSIWEPACGDGAISQELEAAGYTVRSTDLIDRGYGTPGVDFLQQKDRCRNLVTNPPFKLALPFMKHALAVTDRKVALLGRLAWLEGQRRRALYEAHPPARVWVFSRRLTMLRGGWDGGKGGGSMTAFAWFVWDRDHRGATVLGWL